MHNLLELLRGNPYPGRGIVVGRDADGRETIYYWIMGRSANSQNRIFRLTEDGIETQPFDMSSVEDPSLIIYHPVRSMGEDLVVTNGDQTDDIVSTGDFRAALMGRSFEPDGPNYTPRISALVRKDGSFELAILKSQNPAAPDGGRCLREFFSYEGLDAGQGYFISTYEGDGNPLPSFVGEPVEVDVPAPQDVWAALNPDNKVSLYARIAGTVQLFNKNLND